MSIPKVIHCCWLGNKKMPADQEAYVNNYKKLMPDFEVKLWLDKDFAPYLGDSSFVKACIERNKPGFLSDYFRLTVLYEYGGIYMDTDVEMIKPLYPFLEHHMFIGYIFDSLLGTAVIGVEPHSPIIKKMLDVLLTDFENKKDFTVSNNWVTAFFLNNFEDFKLNGRYQLVKSKDILVLPKDYLERYCFDKNGNGGYCEHHCAGSWYDRKDDPFKAFLIKIFGRKTISKIGHFRAVRKSPFYKIYKREKKIK